MPPNTSPRPSKSALEPDPSILCDYYDENQLAAALDLAPITTAMWRTRRQGPPFVRIGRKIYYRKSAVRDWLQNIEVVP